VTEQKRQEKILLQQSKVTAVGEMLSNIAHQWRQPLSIITTDVSGLQIDLEYEDTLSKDRVESTLNNVLKQSNYLSKILDDFKSFFEGDTKKLDDIDLKVVIEKINSITKEMFKSSDIRLISDLESVNIKMNENLLIQAVLNIYNNAKDILILKQNKDDRYFFVELKKEDDNIILSFRDSGGGVSEENIDKIFEPYFTTKHQSLGTGIGLYMTNQIITKQMNSTVEVRNIEYKYEEKDLSGAEFSITLPLKS
jgi:signal transduction histidine kinase